jgi:hypothetical protein
MWALPLLLLALTSRAEDVEGARDNFDTVVRSYAAQRSGDDGVWELKQRGTGKPLRLRYEKAERDTVASAGGGRWRGLADFVAADGKNRYFAEVVVTTGGELWNVSSLSWKTADEAVKLRLAGLHRARSAAARKPGPLGTLPDVALSDARGRETYLPDCAAAKCLTVVVAPWCPYCHQGTGMIKSMREKLEARGVPTRVVVGKDEDDKVRGYGREFGVDSLLDPGDRFGQKGVPHFYVSTDGGGIVAEQSGVPADLDPDGCLKELGF